MRRRRAWFRLRLRHRPFRTSHMLRRLRHRLRCLCRRLRPVRLRPAMLREARRFRHGRFRHRDRGRFYRGRGSRCRLVWAMLRRLRHRWLRRVRRDLPRLACLAFHRRCGRKRYGRVRRARRHRHRNRCVLRPSRIWRVSRRRGLWFLRAPTWWRGCRSVRQLLAPLRRRDRGCRRVRRVLCRDVRFIRVPCVRDSL
jgi:hypothetical protein